MSESIEIRKETCTVASKLVTVKLYRALNTELIIRFECDSSADKCLSRCTYKQLTEDY